MFTLKVPERGHVDVDRRDWMRLSAEPYFWHLVSQRVLSVSQSSQNRMRLEGSCYVGKALFSDICIELAEKVEGALTILLGSAKKEAFRVFRVSSLGSETGPLIGILVAQFLSELRMYVSKGREFQYAKRREIGSLVSGRIDMTRSLQLRARGLMHLLAFDRSVLLRNTLKNRVLLAATREVETLSHILGLERILVSDARALALLFDDCRDAEVLFGERKQFLKYSESLIEQPGGQIDGDLLMLAGVILSHASFEPVAVTSKSVPRAWFLNLETLFENRVRDTLRDLLFPGVKVLKGANARPPRFVYRDQNIFQAEPDLVIQKESRPVAIGDVKYKNWLGTAGQDDIYQLLIHAESFEVKKAFLVFPHDQFQRIDLGNSANGTHTWLFAIDIKRVPEQLAECLSAMNIS